MKKEEIAKNCRQLEPVIGEKARRLYKAYLSTSMEDRDEIEELVDILHVAKLGKDSQRSIFLPPSRNLSNGDFHIGNAVYLGKPFCEYNIRKDEWIKHTLITGMSGTGKTNAGFVICKSLKDHDVPFIVFDWKKNYRDLLQVPEFANLKVFTIGKEISPLRFNPLIPPPGTLPKEWIVKLMDVISHAFFTGHGVEFLLREAIDKLYHDRGIYDGSKNYPTFSDLYSEVTRKTHRGRMMLWHHSLIRVLADLSFDGAIGSSVNVQGAFPLEELLEEPVIIELDALGNTDKIFFTEILLLWIYEYRKNNCQRENFNHAIIIEEAHHILSAYKEAAEGQETIIETTLRQVREFGEGVIAIDQEPHKVSDSIKANTFTKICFNLGNGKDVENIALCMNLDRQQSDCLDQLIVGQAIVKMKGRYLEPFLLEFPLFPVKKGNITDLNIKEQMNEYLRILKSNSAISIKPGSVRTVRPPDVLSPLEKAMLISIAEKPFFGTVQRYTELGLNRYEGNKIKDSLNRISMIMPVTVDRNKLYELTKKGIDHLWSEGIEIKLNPKEGGLEHRYWVERVCKKLSSEGWKVKREKDDIDIVAEKDGKTMAIEVETGKSNLNYSIEKLNNYDVNYKILTMTNNISTNILTQQLPDKKILLFNYFQFENYLCQLSFARKEAPIA